MFYNDIVANLKEIDDLVEQDGLELVVVGGSCIILHGLEKDRYGEMRITGDIDSVENSNKSLLESFYIDSNTSEFYHLYLEDWEDRLVRFDGGFERIEVFLLGGIDLFFSKLAAGRSKDIDDCIVIKNQFQLGDEELEEKYKEWIALYPSNEMVVESNFNYIMKER